MKFTYTIQNLEDFLETMLSYIKDNGASDASREAYFQEITQTGLFHDAVGKVESKTDSTITVVIDY